MSTRIYNYSHNIFFLCLYNQINESFMNNIIDYYFLNELNRHTLYFEDFKKLFFYFILFYL